jgi:DNA-binding response OmpR family regulator
VQIHPDLRVPDPRNLYHVLGQDPTDPPRPPLILGPLRLDPERYEATVHGRPLTLTTTQFRLLQLLMKRPGWIVDDPQFRRRLGNPDAAAPGRSALKHHVAGLRRALGDAGSLIQTVRGQGYRLADPAAPSLTQG